MGEQNFICKICGKSFKTRAGLATHIGQTEKLTQKEYFDKYVENWFHKCKYCEQEARYGNNFTYLPTCGCVECATKLSKDTRLAKYGDANYVNLQQRKCTNIERYGVSCVLNTQDSITKRVQNYKELMENPEYANWRRSLKTGESNGMYGKHHTEESKLKMKHVGADNGMYGKHHTAEAKMKMSTNRRGPKKQRYEQDGLLFDSTLEVQYYNLLKSSDLSYTYLRGTKKLLYYDKTGKSHTYWPDLEINGKLVEIKTKAAFNENGIMYNHRSKDRSLDYVYEAKHNCMISNNVIILTEDDLSIEKIQEKLNETRNTSV